MYFSHKNLETEAEMSGNQEEKKEGGSSSQRLQTKELEEIFISRFEKNFREFSNFGQIFNPLESRYYSASSAGKDPLHSNKYRRVIEVMKKNKIFDRSVLEDMPLNEVSRFEIYSRRFFGKKVLKVVVAALCLSSLEDLILCEPPQGLGLMALEDALQSIVREREVYYYLGIASTSGWEGKVLEQIPKGINWAAGIIEHIDSSHWRLTFPEKEVWSGMENIYDPEMDSEKIERSKRYFGNHPNLRLKGGHILLDDLYREIGVPDYLFVQALEDVLRENSDLEVKDVSGKKILRKKRL